MSKDERIETGMSKPALNISLWVAQALLFLVFAGGGVWKIVTPLHEIEAMMSWVGEVPPPFFYATAALDLLGGLGLLLPSLTRIKPELTHWAALGCAALMLGAALFTWTVVLYGLAYWAERSGAIGGIPTLLLAQIVFVHLKLWIGDESPSISSLLVQMGGVAFALPLLIGPDELIKRTPSEGATRQELLFPWLVAGMIPVTLAMAFLGWPALISAWLGASSPMREVTALLDEYPWWTLLIVAAAGLIFAPDFYRIGVLRRLDELLGLASESYPAEKSRFFRTRNLYLGYLSLIWFFALAAWSKGIPIDLATPFILVALCLDGASLLIFRANYPDSRTVYRCDRVYWAVRITRALRARGMAVHLSGLRHRSLLHFFGPYVSINVVVATHDADEAEKILDSLKRNGLPQPLPVNR